MEGGFRGRHVLTLSWGAEGDFLPFSSFEAVKWIKHCNRQPCVCDTTRSWISFGLIYVQHMLSCLCMLSVVVVLNCTKRLQWVFRVSFLGWGREEELPWCWVNAEPRAPGGYSSPRGSERSPVGCPPPPGRGWGDLDQGPTWTLWGPVGPLPAKTLENWETRVRGSPTCVCLFVCLAEEVTFRGWYLFIHKFLWRILDH